MLDRHHSSRDRTQPILGPDGPIRRRLTRRGPEPRRVGNPNHHTVGTDSLRQAECHSIEQPLFALGCRQPPRQVGEHLIRGRPLPVHQPVRPPLQPLAHRLEGKGDERCGRDRQPQVGSGEQGTNADHRGDVDRCDEHRQPQEHERPVDDDVDVVQPVFRDGDAERHRDEGEGDGAQQGRTGSGSRPIRLKATMIKTMSASAQVTQRYCSRSSPTLRL